MKIDGPHDVLALIELFYNAKGMKGMIRAAQIIRDDCELSEHDRSLILGAWQGKAQYLKENPVANVLAEMDKLNS